LACSRVARIVGARVFIIALRPSTYALTVDAQSLLETGPLSIRTGCIVREHLELATFRFVADPGSARIPVIAHHRFAQADHPVAAGCAGIVGGAHVAVVAAYAFCFPVADAGVGGILFGELVAPGVPARDLGFAIYGLAGEAKARGGT